MPGNLIFLSRVTSEFGDYDDELKARLAPLCNTALKTPADIAGYESGYATLDKLWHFIKDADAVIHLIGKELGSKPPTSMVDEFLKRDAEIERWLQEHQLGYQTWTYTQWEIYLAKFRQHQAGGSAPMLFVCRLDDADLGDPLAELNADNGYSSPLAMQLEALRCLSIHANIRFREVGDLLTSLMTSAFGALVHKGSQEAIVLSEELGPRLLAATPARALSTWPQLTSADDKGRWLNRPELEQILDTIHTNRRSLTLLLGSPGTGKSALLARIATKCEEDGVTVVPIKADFISEDVVDEAGLARELGLPDGTDLVTSVRRMSIDGKVVVLLDQLDALARLIVQRPARLRLLTEVIHDLSEEHNIHLVVSCRTFEQRHDPLLKLIEADTIELDLPAWTDVEHVLGLHDIDTTGWSAKLKEMLRNPQALATFLVLSGQSVDLNLSSLTTYHRMLDRLWEERILVSDGGRRSQVVQLVAEVLADREALWLPLAMFDGQRTEIDHMVAADVLRIEDGRIGFRHQTLFEHARARAVACNPGLLVDTIRAKQGQLRVRPQIWHGLTYLRSVDPDGYHAVLDELWRWCDLRPHMRMLVLDFMGSQHEPTDAEVQSMFSTLDNEAWQSRALTAMTGSPGWFRRLCKERLPELMRQDSGRQRAVLQLLITSHAFDQNATLDLVREYWLPTEDAAWLAWHALERVETWTPRAIVDLSTLTGARDIAARRIDDICATISVALPEEAPKVLRAWLDRQWMLDRSEERQLDTDACPEEREAVYRLDRRKKVLVHSELYSARDIAAAAPMAFIEAIWPWFLEVVREASYEGNSALNAFKPSSMVDLELDDDSDRTGDCDLIRALDVALADWAGSDPTRFRGFLDQNSVIDNLLVQRLLARALTRVADRETDAALTFLISDARRFALGPEYRCHTETWALVDAIFPLLDASQRARLETMMVDWTPYRDLPDEDDDIRAKRETWRREHRLLLLRSIPEAFRSPELSTLIQREEAAFPDVQPMESPTTLREVNSPVSAEQMKSMSDDELIATLLELPDSTGWSHPKEPMGGGAIQVGRELGKLAQSEPHRAMELVRRLPPATHTIHAGHGLTGVVSAIPAEIIYDFAQDLLRRGFDGDGFRRDVARAVEGIVSAEAPLPEPLCASLESWLAPDHGPWSESESYDLDQSESMLWQQGGMRVIPSTVNRAVLAAMGKGYRVTEPPPMVEMDGDVRGPCRSQREPGRLGIAGQRTPVLGQRGSTARARLRRPTAIKSLSHSPIEGHRPLDVRVSGVGRRAPGIGLARVVPESRPPELRADRG